MLTIENTDSDLKARELHYANEPIVRVRLSFPFKNFCKLTKQAETIRNRQNRFWLWWTIVWETHKLTRYQSREFSCYILKSEQTQKHTRKLTTSVSRSYYSIPARDWSLDFDPEKPTFSVSSEHKTTYKRPGSYSLPYSLPSLWKIRKRISQYIWRQDGAICSKNKKIVPYHRCARIPRLTVSVPDYGAWGLKCLVMNSICVSFN